MPQKLGGTGSAVLGDASVKPTGASLDVPLGQSLGEILSPRAFGAIPDGVLSPDGTASGTDNTAALNAYFAKCRDLGIRWRLPQGDWLCLGTITAYGEGDPDGRFLFPNSNIASHKFVVAPRPEDVRVYDNTTSPTGLSIVQGWTASTLVRRSRAIGGLTGLQGQYITVETPDQLLIQRRGRAGSLNLGEGFLVADNDGRLAHSLFATWLPNTWSNCTITTKTARERIQLYGLKFALYVDPWWQTKTPWSPNTAYAVGAIVSYQRGVYRCATAHTSGTQFDMTRWDAQVADSLLRVDRPHTDIIGTSIVNYSGSEVAQAHLAQYVCNVNYTNCHVEGLKVDSTNYAFNSNLSADLTYSECSEINCRRGIDAHKSKYIRIRGGSLADGWGAHYAWWMGSDGTTIGAGTPTTVGNPQALNIAGGGFHLHGGTVTLGDQANAVVRIRADIYEMGDYLSIQDVSIITTRSAEIYLIDGAGPATTYDLSRRVEFFRRLTIRNNNIIVRGATGDLNIITLFRSTWTQSLSSEESALPSPPSVFPQKIEMMSRWNIDGNQIIFENGSIDDRLIKIIYYKPDMIVSDGVDAHIADWPKLYIQAACPLEAATDPVTGPQARFSARVSRVRGTTTVRYTNGAAREIIVDGDLNGARLTGDANPAIGDELVAPCESRWLNLTGDRARFSLKGGAAFDITDKANVVNRLIVQGGATGEAPMFLASGEDGNVGITFGTRQNGPFTFNTSFSIKQFTIAHTANAVNSWQVRGGASGQQAILEVIGENGAGGLIRAPNGGPITIQGLVTLGENYGGDVTSATVTVAGTQTTVSTALNNRSSRLYVAVNNVDATISASTASVGVRGLSAPRVLTLPAASSFPQGQTLQITDESGACSTINTITIQRAGSDTIQGGPSVDLTVPYQSLTLRSNGSNLWIYD